LRSCSWPADDLRGAQRATSTNLTSRTTPRRCGSSTRIHRLHTSFYRDPISSLAVTAVLRLEPTRQATSGSRRALPARIRTRFALIAENLGRPVSILGTDINSRARSRCDRRHLRPWSVRDLPPSMALPRRADGRFDGCRRGCAAWSRFARHNLMDVPPTARGGAWDVIICRNVSCTSRATGCAR
jgi:hypothetical protein